MSALAVRNAIADDVALLTSELAMNAVEHSATDEIVVRASTDELVRVEVLNKGNTFEPVVAPIAQRGYGLFLVDTVADRWGVEEDSGWTKVWFELR